MQPCVELKLAGGDHLIVALHGAQVLSWKTAEGVERLYLSPRAIFDGRSAIRGGIPICFPQFNQRVLAGKPLPKHGFARSLAWSVLDHQQSTHEDSASVALGLNHDALGEELQTLWPYRFEAILLVRIERDRLSVTFSLTNLDSKAWPFALALHTYLRAGDISKALVRGLQGIRYWDAVKDLKSPELSQPQISADLAFSSETDRVYQAAPAAIQLATPSSTLRVEQSNTFTETVVWNPGAAICSQLADMPSTGYREMLCLEAARIDQAVILQPGENWQGSQMLSVRRGPELN
jgi:glucose-6-phosphate 1-epimerase